MRYDVRQGILLLLVAVIVIVTVIDRLLRNALASGLWSGSFFVSAHAHVEMRLFGWIGVPTVPWIMAIVLVIVTVGVVWILGRTIIPWYDPRMIAFGALIFSAANNLYDRLRFGGVWDYWVVSFPWGGLSFNIADVIITTAIMYLLINSKSQINHKLKAQTFGN